MCEFSIGVPGIGFTWVFGGTCACNYFIYCMAGWLRNGGLFMSFVVPFLTSKNLSKANSVSSYGIALW